MKNPARVAAAIEQLTLGRTYRQVADDFGVGISTIARWVQQAEEAAARAEDKAHHRPAVKALHDHRDVIMARLDDVWDANKNDLDKPGRANVALRAVETTARVMGLITPGAVNVQQTNVTTARLLLIDAARGTVRDSAGAEVDPDEQIEGPVISIDARLVSPPTLIPGDDLESYNARTVAAHGEPMTEAQWPRSSSAPLPASALPDVSQQQGGLGGPRVPGWPGLDSSAGVIDAYPSADE